LIQIIHADVIEGLRQIPDQTVQCVVTSPPYWGLRDYGVEGQIGLEKTPEEFIQKMVEVFREVKQVLRDDGTVWLNLGDCYAHNGPCGGDSPDGPRKPRALDKSAQEKMGFCIPDGLKQKDLIGMPWRVAFALQADGWYLRSDIIWSKPNPMPESVTDRPTKSHEYIFLLTKKPRYYYDADAVREKGTIPAGTHAAFTSEMASGNGIKYDRPDGWVYTGNRNRRTVWEIATQPFPGSHFATFPEALVEPCIKAGTSERGCCSVCGAPWERVVERNNDGTREPGNTRALLMGHSPSGPTACNRAGESRTIMSYEWQPSCSCNADIVPCVVLDPFGGSGTVGKVARDLNRKAILIELNAEYIKIAKERLRLNEQLGAFA
jgi:DNA modification methylase